MKLEYKYLRISGVMSLGGELKLRPSYMTNNSRDSDRLRDSPLQLELYSGSELRLRWGASLLTHSHAGRYEDRQDEKRSQSAADFYAINAKPPISEDIDTIVFLYEGVNVGEIKKPLNSPVISNVKASQLKDMVQVEWTAEHADATPLNYFVRASSDGGDSWYRLGSLLADSVLLVNPMHIVGEKCLIEVVAYDGFNTVSSSIEWSGRPSELQIEIVEPESAVVFCGSVVTLRAEVNATGVSGIIDGPFEWYIDDRCQSSNSSAVAWIPEQTGKAQISVNLRHGDLFSTNTKTVKVVNPGD